MAKVVFLDRDGVINKDVENGYVSSLDMLEIFPQALAGIRQLTQLGFVIIIVSNQAGVSKGLYTEKTLALITQAILDKVRRTGGRIRSIHYCTHQSNENCDCRKPKTALFKQAIKGMSVNLADAFLVGDSERDIEAGKSLGCKTILVLSGKTETKEEANNFKTRPDFMANDLKAAVENIIKCTIQKSS